jgi:hypothetical protein
MRKLIPLWLLFAVGPVAAAPFLTCDPYPTTGAYPTEFVVTVSGIANLIVTPAVDVAGGKTMRLDLGPLNLTGTKTVTVKARNAWGESANSAPFSFTAGSPAPVTGIGLLPN